MYKSTDAYDASDQKGSGENSIRRFYKSLFRRINSAHPEATRDQDGVVAEPTPLEACQLVHQPLKRVTAQGRFEWGSFCAFEDGSIEVERAGVKQWFPDFSELRRSLNQRAAEN